MSIADDTAAAMIGKVYAEAVAARGKEAHQAILAMVKEARMKTATFEVIGDGGESYGTVRYNPGRVTPKVVDPAALLEWVIEHHPDEVRQVPTIREKFLEKLLADAAAGKIEGGLPPGVDVGVGEPYLTITPTEDARARAREVVDGQGRPTLPGLPCTG